MRKLMVERLEQLLTEVIIFKNAKCIKYKVNYVTATGGGSIQKPNPLRSISHSFGHCRSKSNFYLKWDAKGFFKRGFEEWNIASKTGFWNMTEVFVANWVKPFGGTQIIKGILALKEYLIQSNTWFKGTFDSKEYLKQWKWLNKP